MKFIHKSIITTASLFLLTTICTVHSEENATVYTEGVTFISKEKAKDNTVIPFAIETNTTIANVGDFKAIPGDMPKGYIAFVKPKKGLPYFVGDNILVKCKKNNKCVPSALNFTSQASDDLYQVKLTSYDEYKFAMKELKQRKDVERVIPSLFFGHKPKLK